MRQRLAALFDKLAPRIDLAAYLWAGISAVSGFVTAHFASANAWIAAFGPIGYWTSGLLGALIVAIIGLIIARIRLWWMTGAAIDKWKTDVSSVNPLDAQFTRLRLKLQDLAHPVERKIANKTFVDCELMGPAILVMGGPGNVNGTTLAFCDFVVMDITRRTPINNCILLENVNIIRGSFWNVTLLIPPDMVPTFQQMGAVMLTAIPPP